jgi:hypothetical protein
MMILYKKRSEGSPGPTPFIAKVFNTFQESVDAINDGWVEAPHLIEKAIKSVETVVAKEAKKA